MGLATAGLDTSGVQTAGLQLAGSELSELPAPGMLHTTRWCAGCADERAFETPPCQDDHGDDCLDLACVECGHAIVVGFQAAAEVRVVEFAAA